MKKASFNIAGDLPQWLFRGFVLLIILIVLFTGLWIHLSRDVNISKYESQLISYNVLSCLAYTDEKVHLGTIDKTKLSLLNDCIKSNDIAFMLLLKYPDDVEERYYFNKQDYDSYEPLCNTDIKNKVYKYCYNIKHYVLINNKEPAFAEFRILLKDFEVGS